MLLQSILGVRTSIRRRGDICKKERLARHDRLEDAEGNARGRRSLDVHLRTLDAALAGYRGLFVFDPWDTFDRRLSAFRCVPEKLAGKGSTSAISTGVNWSCRRCKAAQRGI